MRFRCRAKSAHIQTGWAMVELTRQLHETPDLKTRSPNPDIGLRLIGLRGFRVHGPPERGTHTLTLNPAA